MNAAHLHLILNHLPVIGMVIALALLIYGLIRQSAEIKRVALGLTFIAAITTPAVYLSGENAEDIVEDLGVSESFIETHEGHAETALILSQITALIALISLIAAKKRPASLQRWTYLTLAATLVTSGSLGLTANSGGQIRHTEIRDTPPSQGQPVSRSQDFENEDEDHND